MSIRASVCFSLLIAFALAFVPGAHHAQAEEPIPTSLDTSEASDFVGYWDMAMDFNGNEVHFFLNIVDLNGKLGATIDSPQQPEPMAVEEITKTDEGIDILYEMSFGSNRFEVTISAKQEGEGLAGTIREKSNLFSADFTATPREFDPEAAEQRRRSRRQAANQARMRIGDKKITINFADLRTGSEDFERLQKLETGDVFEYVGGRATKIFTDFDLKFEDGEVKYGNAAPDYPGVYSVWLKKADDGWKVVFNEEADIWGTMHNPEADVAEIAAEVSEREEEAQRFVIELEEQDAGGLLKIAWGNQEWSAPFKLGGVSEEELANADTSAPKVSPAVLSDIVGAWEVTVDSPQGPLQQRYEIDHDGSIAVTTNGQDSPASDLAQKEGDLLTFDVSVMGFDLTFEGTFDDEAIDGKYLMNGQEVATITGKRVST